MADKQQRQHAVLSGRQTVQSIRDTGYKSTDYAIAELIDNSVQENASVCTIVLITDKVAGKQRETTQVVEILVVDDGDGMKSEVLGLCLAFGGSDRYDDRKGIGRFGMGLPQASVSQAKRVDVWSWQKSQPSRALATYLDLDEMSASSGSDQLLLPIPSAPGDKAHLDAPSWLPELQAAAGMKTSMKGGVEVSSGTVVRWTNLDRLRWVRADGIKNNTEALLGRIYRHYLLGHTDQKLRLVLCQVDRNDLEDESKWSEIFQVEDLRPNDPLYLAIPSETTLEFWEKGVKKKRIEHESMMKRYERGYKSFTISAEVGDGESRSGVVDVATSKAPAVARPGKQAGRTTHHGRHAAQNLGVSVVRHGREITLDQSLNLEDTDRWWGIEVAFEPELDELFGVTNNKQEVPYFSQALQLAREHRGMKLSEALDEAVLPDGEHPTAALWDLAQHVQKMQQQMKNEGRSEQSNLSKNTKEPPDVNAQLSKQKVAGTLKESDAAARFREQNPSDDDQREAIRKEVADANPEITEEELDNILELRERKFMFQVMQQTRRDDPAFFWPEEYGDIEVLILNEGHPAHARLIEPLRLTNDEISAMSETEAKQRLSVGTDALAMLLLMWTHMEMAHQDDTAGHEKIQETRRKWGNMIKTVLKDPAVLNVDELLDAIDEQ